MGRFERRLGRRGIGQRHRQLRIRPVVPQPQRAPDFAGLRALGGHVGPGERLDLGQHRLRPRHARSVQHRLHAGLPQRRHLGLPDAPGRQHAAVPGAKHRLDAQRLGRLARDLTGRAAERHQGVVAGIEAAFGGDAAHGLGHLFHRHGDEALGGGLYALGAHGLRQHVQPRPARRRVQGGVALRPEHRREESGVEPAQHQVRVRHRRRPAPAVAGRPRIGPGAGRAGAGPHAVERQDRAAAGRHRLHVQHRAAQLHAGDLRRVPPLQDAREPADVRRCPAHVETQNGDLARLRRRPRHADHPAGRAGDHRVAAPERLSRHQSARRGHEVERRTGHRVGHPAHIGLQHRRQVGVGHRRLRPRDEAGQG